MLGILKVLFDADIITYHTPAILALSIFIQPKAVHRADP
eukprot:gene3171-3251_t